MNILRQSKPQASFSKAALSYEEFSDIQKKVGLTLLENLPTNIKGGRILDVGMGTGWLTEKVAERFPDADIFGVDFAEGMVQSARKKNIDFVIQADARALPFQKESFDLIVSNCAYQWVEDLKKTFTLNREILRSHGYFCFTCFGESTLKELWESLGTVNRLHCPTEKDIRDALRTGGFYSFEVSSVMMRQEFGDMFDLVRWLKRIGANQTKREIFIGRDALSCANDFYCQNFESDNGVFATFEIIMGKTQK
ncbi:MAG: methyltransferase domain-containing protein [Candidatus Aceula meridiana]|nr:methyltransferase domain-containing protein [Candidatus Aceula meridiana]